MKCMTGMQLLLTKAHEKYTSIQPCEHVIQEIEEKTQAGDALTLTMDDLESSPADTDSKPSDGRIILDDIDWDVISAQHGTRAAPQCLTKWYTQLAPSMVSKGKMNNSLLHHHSKCVVFHIGE